MWNTGSVTLQGGSINAGGFDAAAGTFTFADGTLTVNGGTYRGGNTTLTLDGTGSANPTLVLNGASAAVAGNATIGGSGTGTLSISNGGTVSSADGYLGFNGGARGLAVVDGTSSTWTNSGKLTVGNSGDGYLFIQNGGTVSSNISYLGLNNGSSGTATVDGANSTWTNAALVVGGSSGGRGSLTVRNDGAVQVAGNMRVWDTVSLENGGTLTVNGNITNNANGTFSVGNGATASVGSTGLLNHGLFAGAGTLVGNVTSYGTVGPGASPGTLTIDGDYNQLLSGIFSVEIGGLFAGTEYDVLNVTGTASLAGSLDVSLFDPGPGLFSPQAGDSFDILAAEILQGSFGSLNYAALPDPSLSWHIDYLVDAIGSTDIVRLSVVSAVPVPAAVWLFGSGLIGLLGLARRKRSA